MSGARKGDGPVAASTTLGPPSAAVWPSAAQSVGSVVAAQLSTVNLTLMLLEAIAYTSSAAPGLDDARLEALLARARKVNAELGVTGVLLHHEGSFLQYFEGPPEGVARAYERICRCSMHRGLIELMRRPIEQRCFGDWVMGFTRTPKSAVLQLSNASWRTSMQSDNAPSHVLDSEGMSLLQQFWQSNVGRKPRAL